MFNLIWFYPSLDSNFFDNYRKTYQCSKIERRKFQCGIHNIVAKLYTEDSCSTVKFLNFRTPENFAVIFLKFKQRGQSLGYFIKTMQME